jgi:hypothetical protein
MMKQLIASILAGILLFGACGGSGSPSGTDAPAHY